LSVKLAVLLEMNRLIVTYAHIVNIMFIIRCLLNHELASMSRILQKVLEQIKSGIMLLIFLNACFSF